jgi:hypothetical protein
MQNSISFLKLFRLTLGFVALVSIFGCSGENSESKKGDEKILDNNFKPGILSENIECTQNKVYSYTLYLPTFYNAQKKFPVVIVFDAHARGKMAAGRFKEASEKFGYIIMASNNAKNGLEEIDDVVNNLFIDALNIPGIDRNRIYTAGFSGGARIASSAAIYKGGIKGVIALAGGMPTVGQELSQKFNFIGVVGLNDFNYHEMKTLDKALSVNGFTNQLLTFNGNHEWPSAAVLAKAVEWQELMAMKKKEIPVNDNLVRNYLANSADSINAHVVSGLNYQAYLLYNNFFEDLDGLYDVADFKKSYEALLKNPEIDNTIKAEKNSDVAEMAKQEVLLNMFKSGNYSGIRKEIATQFKNSGSTNYTILHSSRRLLSFIGMLCYVYTENAVNSQNKTAFSNLIEIYTLVEPKNPDKEFYKACQAMMDNEHGKAFDYLNKAIEFGYYDANRLQNIGYFEQIRTKPEFDRLIKGALVNLNNQK